VATDVNGRFAWVDLSTFDVSAARTFYSAVFEWTFRGSESDYGICVAGHTAAAGLYEMPDRFQAINMPSFWMSYVQVDDLEHTPIRPVLGRRHAAGGRRTGDAQRRQR